MSSGQPVAYGISVTNNGPDAATGITVTDTPSEGATVQSGSGTDWSCDPVVENTLTCHYTGNEGVLPPDSTAALIRAVGAPPTTADLTFRLTAVAACRARDRISRRSSIVWKPTG